VYNVVVVCGTSSTCGAFGALPCVVESVEVDGWPGVVESDLAGITMTVDVRFEVKD
jgi:hypothetical protein